jgi:hypothetical protein
MSNIMQGELALSGLFLITMTMYIYTTSQGATLLSAAVKGLALTIGANVFVWTVFWSANKMLGPLR